MHTHTKVRNMGYRYGSWVLITKFSNFLFCLLWTKSAPSSIQHLRDLPMPLLLVDCSSKLISTLFLLVFFHASDRVGRSSSKALDYYSGNARFESWFGTLAILTEDLFCRFSSVPPGKYRDSASIRPQPLPSKSFKIHHSSIILPFCVI
jgi:hypothetical protein